MEHLFVIFILSLGYHFLWHRVEGLKADKIVGGYEAFSRQQFKYVVAVMYDPQEDNSTHKNPCTGTIIGDQFIITVGHCFYDEETGTLRHKEYYITSALTNIYNPSLLTGRHRVHLIYFSIYYNPLSKNLYNSKANLAIVKIENSFGLRPGHNILKKLRLSRDLRKIINNQFIVSGFGWNQISIIRNQQNNLVTHINGKSDGKLRFAYANVLEENDCHSLINDTLAWGNICAKIEQQAHDHKGICKHDSGSPLANDRFLIGVAINGPPECDENIKPGLYLSMAYYAPFIEAVMIGNRSYNMRVYELKKNNEGFAFELI